MPIDPLPLWKKEFKNLKPVGDKDPPGKWADNLADFIDQRVTNKMTLGTPIMGPPSTFTFQKALFSAPLKALQAVPDPISGRTAVANAWQSAILASTMVPGAGIALGSPAPPTLFSAPPVCMIFPVSVTLAYAGLLMDLIGLGEAQDPLMSKMPDALYTAFTKLQFMLQGLNSIPPPAGPLPLIVPTVPVL